MAKLPWIPMKQVQFAHCHRCDGKAWTIPSRSWVALAVIRSGRSKPPIPPMHSGLGVLRNTTVSFKTLRDMGHLASSDWVWYLLGGLRMPQDILLEICFNKVPPTGCGLSRSLFWPVEWGWPISVFEFDRVNMFNPMIVPYYPMKHPIADLFWMQKQQLSPILSHHPILFVAMQPIISHDMRKNMGAITRTPGLPHVFWPHIRVDYNDLTVFPHWKSWLIREIIPKWPNNSG